MSRKRSAAEMLSFREHIIDLTIDDALGTEDDDKDKTQEKEEQSESTQKMSQESSDAPQQTKAEGEDDQVPELEDFDGVPDSQPAASAASAKNGAPHKSKGKETAGEEDDDDASPDSLRPSEPPTKRCAARLDDDDWDDVNGGSGRSGSRTGLVIAVAGTSGKTKVALINTWIGRDLLPYGEAPQCTLRVHHCNIDHIVIAEPAIPGSHCRATITFSQLYQAVDYLREKTLEGDTSALDIVLRFASDCPALMKPNLITGRANPVMEFTYLRAYIRKHCACKFLADCESLVWCEPGDICLCDNMYTFEMGRAFIRCRPDLFRRCSVVIADSNTELQTQKDIYSGLKNMWSHFDARDKWPLLEPAFGDKEQVAAFAFARRGGQTVWCLNDKAPLDAASVLRYARTAATAPVVDDRAEMPPIGPACTRAALLGGLSLIPRIIVPAAQRFIESEMMVAPKDNPYEWDKFVAKFCDEDLRAELYRKCFAVCYDRNVLAMWRVMLMLPRPSRFDGDVLRSLCKLPLHAYECMGWNPANVPEFLDPSGKALSEEDQKLALSFYKRGARSVADTLVGTLGLKFDLDLGIY